MLDYATLPTAYGFDARMQAECAADRFGTAEEAEYEAALAALCSATPVVCSVCGQGEYPGCECAPS